MFWDAYSLEEALRPIVFIALVVYNYALPAAFARFGDLPKWYILAQWSGHKFKKGDTSGNSTWRISALPPPYVFGIVWGILHITTPLAIYIYWTQYTSATASYWGWNMFLYVVLVALECGWSLFFWGYRYQYNVQRVMFIVAFVDLIATWAIGGTIMILFIIDEAWASFGLMVPYVLWTTYAAYLNLRFIMLGFELRGDDDLFYGKNTDKEFSRIVSGYNATYAKKGGGELLVSGSSGVRVTA